ncbi:hypothetical protein L6452_04553 [Arctium lappa]|uniref:Uncharacterized protein n=1 Tax=Arctium lappa TaxID=4217 RepID=A0ACB9EDU9_ARCLA|nr:hypothetical protein L6452_04553 [Arctium lappa]
MTYEKLRSSIVICSFVCCRPPGVRWGCLKRVAQNMDMGIQEELLVKWISVLKKEVLNVYGTCMYTI